MLGLPVQQPADHVGPSGIAELETDEYFVTDFRQEQVAPLLAHTDLHNAGPIGLVERGQPREAELHPSPLLRVVVVGDDTDDVAVDR